MSGSGTGRAAHVTLESIDGAVAAIREHTSATPEVAIVDAAGAAAALTAAMEVAVTVPVPLLAPGAGPERTGEWRFGTLGGTRVVVLDDLVRAYEGHALQATSWPIRVLGRLGARHLIRTDRVGGLNPLWAAGDLARVDDHINLMGDNPLVGPNLDALGPRFPDMSQAYDPELGRLADAVALELRVPLRQGVYAAVPGPNLETRAEDRVLRSVGADMVGTGVVPDVIIARHMGVRVLALAVVADARLPETGARTLPRVGGEAGDAVGSAVETLGALVREVVERMGRGEAHGW